MLSKNILGSAKGETRCIRLGQGVLTSRERAGGPVFGCTLCPGPASLVYSGLRAECVVIWDASWRVSAWEEGIGRMGSKHRVLCLRAILLPWA